MVHSGLDDQVSSFPTYEDNESNEKVSNIVLEGNCVFA